MTNPHLSFHCLTIAAPRLAGPLAARAERQGWWGVDVAVAQGATEALEVRLGVSFAEQLLAQGKQDRAQWRLVALAVDHGHGHVDEPRVAVVMARMQREPGPVSYTHLTLPTICSV